VHLGNYDLKEIVMSAVTGIEAQALASVSTSYVPNQASVGLCPQDADRYRWLLEDIGHEVGAILSARARDRDGVTLIGAPRIAVVRDETARPGRPTIYAQLRRSQSVDDASHPSPLRPTTVIDTVAVSMPAVCQNHAKPGWFLVVNEDGQRRTVSLAGDTLVGRGRDAGLRLRDMGVSRTHSRLVPTPRRVLVSDENSRNGTFLDGERVTSAYACEGDVLRFGPHCEATLTRTAVA
jgi:hypothetical protein